MPGPPLVSGGVAAVAASSTNDTSGTSFTEATSVADGAPLTWKVNRYQVPTANGGMVTFGKVAVVVLRRPVSDPLAAFFEICRRPTAAPASWRMKRQYVAVVVLLPPVV